MDALPVKIGRTGGRVQGAAAQRWSPPTIGFFAVELEVGGQTAAKLVQSIDDTPILGAPPHLQFAVVGDPDVNVIALLQTQSLNDILRKRDGQPVARLEHTHNDLTMHALVAYSAAALWQVAGGFEPLQLKEVTEARL